MEASQKPIHERGYGSDVSDEVQKNESSGALQRKKRRKDEDFGGIAVTDSESKSSSANNIIRCGTKSTQLHASFQSVKEITDTSYWRSLCPFLHVSDTEFINQKLSDLELVVLSKRQANELKASMQTEGYFQLDREDINWVCLVREVERAVHILREHDWHPLWIIVYDEVWLMAYQIFELLRRIVNKNLVFNRDFFAWYVDNGIKEGGWEPHRDRHNMTFDKESAPNYATVWIAITRATPENSCIYLLPATRDQFYHATDESQDTSNTIDYDSLSYVRAVPVYEPGGIIAWSGKTLHFGGRSNDRAKGPRISIAFGSSSAEYEDPYLRDFTERTNDLNRFFPSLEGRLHIIATQLWTYSHRIALPSFLTVLLEDLDKFFQKAKQSNNE